MRKIFLFISFLCCLCACERVTIQQWSRLNPLIKWQIIKDKSAIMVHLNASQHVEIEKLSLEEPSLDKHFRNPEKTKIAVFTESPGDTMGDPSAASKLMSSLRSSQPDFDFLWIIRKENLDFKAIHLIPQNVPTLVIDQWTDIQSPLISTSLRSADLIFSFPTFHYLANSDVDYLESEFSAPYVRATEYDFMELDSVYKPWLPILKSGFCRECLGIFTHTPTPLHNAISAISSEDSELKSLLETCDAKADKLYFGYFNKEQTNEVTGNWANLVNFALLSIFKSALESGDTNNPFFLNLVLPASVQQFEEIKEGLSKLALSESDLGRRVKKAIGSSQLTYILPKQSQQHKPQILQNSIRVINPYPLSRESMNALLGASNQFVGLTGDQSLSEGLSWSKTIFYQTMRWKSKLFEEYLLSLEEHCFEDLSLVDFLHSTRLSHQVNTEFLLKQAELLSNKKEPWSKTMQDYTIFLKEAKNLEKNFAREILNLIDQ